MDSGKILIVEDEQILTLDLKKRLISFGYEVVGTASSGEVAIDLAFKKKPDLILMDIRLKGTIDGIEAAHTILEHQTAAIIYLSAHSGLEILERAKSTESYGFLTKPVSHQELQAILATSLTRYRLEKRLRESESRMTLALERAHTVIWDLDLKRKTFCLSGSGASQIGLAKIPFNDLSYDSWVELIHPEDRQWVLNTFQDHVSGKTELYDAEYRLKVADGSFKWFHALGSSSQLDEHGNPVFITGTVADISERKLADEMLQRKNVLIQMLYRACRDALSKKDPTTIFQQVLTSLLELTKSEAGFIGEIVCHDNESPFLCIRTFSHNVWNEKTKIFFNDNKQKILEFKNPNSLFGAVISSKKHVISNNPATDPRSAGTPPDHPNIRNFLGLPFFLKDQNGNAKGKLVGMAGLANCRDQYSEEIVEFLEPFSATCAVILNALKNEPMSPDATSPGPTTPTV